MQTHHEEINSLGPAQIEQVLKEGSTAHLACLDKGELYVVPVTYFYEDGFIYSHARLGKKILAMRQHPKVCLQVEEVTDLFQWRSVIAWGEYEELPEEESQRVLRQLVNRIARNHGSRSISSLDANMDALLSSVIVYRIKITKTSGRFEGRV